MNKTQLVCLLVAIVTALSAGVWLQARSHHRHFLLACGHMIGEELIATTRSCR